MLLLKKVLRKYLNLFRVSRTGVFCIGVATTWKTVFSLALSSSCSLILRCWLAELHKFVEREVADETRIVKWREDTGEEAGFIVTDMNTFLNKFYQDSKGHASFKDMKSRFDRQVQYHSMKKVKGEDEWIHNHFTKDGSSLSEVKRKRNKKNENADQDETDSLKRRIAYLEIALEETNKNLKQMRDMLKIMLMVVYGEDSAEFSSTIDPSSCLPSTKKTRRDNK